MIIVYCEKCGLRIPDREFESGGATRGSDGSHHCGKCSPAVTVAAEVAAVPARTSVKGTDILKPQGADPRSSKIIVRPAAAASRPVASGTEKIPPPAGSDTPKKKSLKKLWIMAACSVGAGCILGGVILLNSDKKTSVDGGLALDRNPPAPPAAVERKPDPVEVAPPALAITADAPLEASVQKPKTADEELAQLRGDRAERLLAEAKMDRPNSPSYKEKLTQLVTTYRSTHAAEEAATLLQAATKEEPAAPAVAVAATPAPAPQVAPAAPPPAAPVAALPSAATSPAAPAIPVPAPPMPQGELDVIAAKREYEQFIFDFYGLLAKGNARAALSNLEKARDNPKLSTLRERLALDAECAQFLPELSQAAANGALMAADKPALTLHTLDDKDIALGKGSKNKVTEIKNGIMTIEQDLGGGVATRKMDMERLTFQSRFELAAVALPPGPDAELKLAYAQLLLLASGSRDATPQLIRRRLAAAQKSQSKARVVEHLLTRLDAVEHEAAAEGAIKNLDTFTRSKQWKEIAPAIAKIRADFAITRTLAKYQAELERDIAFAEDQINPLHPGLWASYWSGDVNDKFKTMHVARVESKLCWDWHEGSPDPAVPADFFGIRWGGLIRIEHEGNYQFRLGADDSVELFIDGNKVASNGQEVGVQLTAGDHAFKVVYFEVTGPANMRVHWKFNGVPDWVEIPVNLFFHDPRQAESYQK